MCNTFIIQKTVEVSFDKTASDDSIYLIAPVVATAAWWLHWFESRDKNTYYIWEVYASSSNEPLDVDVLAVEARLRSGLRLSRDDEPNPLAILEIIITQHIVTRALLVTQEFVVAD